MLNSIKKTISIMTLIGAMALPFAATAQNESTELGNALMQMDGSAPAGRSAASAAAATGWFFCNVVRTGAGWGNHYAALTCPSASVTNKWYIMKANQKDAMLATALSAATSGKRVQVYISTTVVGSYNELQAVYFHN